MKFATGTLCFILCVMAGCVASSKENAAQQVGKRGSKRSKDLELLYKIITTLDSLNTSLSCQPLLSDLSRQGMVKERLVPELQLETLSSCNSPTPEKVQVVCVVRTWMTSASKYFNHLLDCRESCTKRGEDLRTNNLDELAKLTNKTVDYLCKLARTSHDSCEPPAEFSRTKPNCTECKKEAPLILRDIRRVVTVASTSLKNVPKRRSLNYTVERTSIEEIWKKTSPLSNAGRTPCESGEKPDTDKPKKNKAKRAMQNNEVSRRGKGKKQRKQKAGQKKKQ